MTDRRESIEIGQEESGETPATSSRRFARLVESPAARRVALPRLVAAAAVSIGLVWLAATGVRSLVGWVAARPDQQLAFSKIELIPPPEPWIVGGRARILEQVRADSKLPETLPLLELDLKALRNDFRRCPWVKDVTRVERSYRALTVHLLYRKPVAVVVLEKHLADGNAYVIDEEGVPLPPKDIDGKFKDLRFQVVGISGPLIEIRGVLAATVSRFGVPWKIRDESGSMVDDPRVLGAARLAEFLQRQPRTTPNGRKAPEFVAIWLSGEPVSTFMLRDADDNWVDWGEPPGSEKPGEPSAEARWRMLLDWVDRHGPLDARSPNHLRFTRTEAELVRRGPPPRKPPGDR